MTALIFPKWLENKWAKEKQIEDNRARYKQYYEDHQVCPKCGNGCEQTCMGMGSPDTWGEWAKDTNRAVCAFCHWKGIVDDLVPEIVEEPRVVYNLEETPKGQRCVCRQEN